MQFIACNWRAFRYFIMHWIFVYRVTLSKYPESILDGRFTIARTGRLYDLDPSVSLLFESYRLSETMYSHDMRHVRSQSRGPRAISCVRVEKWKMRGWEVAFFLCCAPDFSCWPTPRVARNRGLMAAKITMTPKGERCVESFMGGSTRMTHDSEFPARAQVEIYARLFRGTSINEFPLLPLSPPRRDFFSFGQKKKL